MTTIKQLRQQIERLAKSDVCIATNAGTYGDTEALNAVGTSEPQFAEYREVVCIGGGPVRKIGPDPERAPGRILRNDALKMERERLETLRSQLAAMELRRKQMLACIEDLNRGWDGYQKADEATCQRKIAELTEELSRIDA